MLTELINLKIFTGSVPFGESISATAIARILMGDRPERPTHPSFTNHLWELTQLCWMGEPQGRPPMDQVIKHLSVLSPVR